MEKYSVCEMTDLVVDAINEKSCYRGGGFVISDNIDLDDCQQFTVEFLAYEYLWVSIEYNNGKVSPCIEGGKYPILLKDYIADWSDIDLRKWLNDLDVEIRLRIPEKYLGTKGWE